MPALRVVIDTNVLVSGLAYPSSIPGRIVSAWRRGAIDVILSRYILDEMRRVLPRLGPIRFSAEEVRNLADSFMLFTDIVEPDGEHEPELRDASDQAVLATFRAASADYLVTGDKDLLVLAGRYPIVTAAEFWARHGE